MLPINSKTGSDSSALKVNSNNTEKKPRMKKASNSDVEESHQPFVRKRRSRAKLLFTMLPEPRTATPEIRVKMNVSKQTKILIDLCDSAIAQVKELLPFGAGNIDTDVRTSGGRSWENMRFSRVNCYIELYVSRDPKVIIGKEAARAVATKGGNCSEFAVLTAAVLNKILPLGTEISICNFSDLFDHTFVVVGNVSNKDSLVVESWPTAGQTLRVKDHRYCQIYSHVVKDGLTFNVDGQDMITPNINHIWTYGGELAKDAVAPYLSTKEYRKTDGYRFYLTRPATQKGVHCRLSWRPSPCRKGTI